ncbi:MAG TPA: aminotransferase [Patescibacteria group bacterium]|nr:aminotransferase [Patescibacteria group bacterium]
MDKTTNCELNADELVRLHREHLWLHITNHKPFESQDPPILVSGQGCMVKDIQGREYLDGLSGGVWCVNAGYGQQKIIDAITEQLQQLPYYSGAMGNPPYIRLAEKLAQLLPGLPKVYIANSGSEANEKSFKISRQYFRLKYPDKDKHKIIYRQRDYHGSTLAVLAATGQDERRDGYGPLPQGFVKMPHALCYRCEFGKSYPGCNLECARTLETIIEQEGPDTVAAIILEPITAGGGIIIPVAEYYPIIQEICRKYEVLIIMDEVVNGFGRTGKMFGSQHYDFEPDMMTMAKGLASSYMPISATVTKKHIFDRFLADAADTMGYFRDISTFGGCAAGCAAALANIAVMEEQAMVENSEKMGRYLLDSLKDLEKLPHVGQVRGKGLFLGIELVADKKSKTPLPEKYLGQMVAAAKAEGVIIGRMSRSVPGSNNVLTAAPPLIINQQETERLSQAFRKVVESFSLS